MPFLGFLLPVSLGVFAVAVKYEKAGEFGAF